MTPELEQTLIKLFKDFLIDELWITDCASAKEIFSTGVRFIYKDSQDAYHRQQEGILEVLESLVEEVREPSLSDFNDYFYQIFGEIIGYSELERVEVID